MSEHAAEPMIVARGLHRSFGSFEAVRGVDLTIQAGESFALLGPNGAGKTTTISMLTTLLRPTGGTGSVNGHDIVHARRLARGSLGIVFQDPTLDIHLTVAENLRFHAVLYNVPRRLIAPRIAQLATLFDIEAQLGSLVRTLSGGLRRRVELARALLHEPPVLFLDEPTIGLDPHARASFHTLLKTLRDDAGTTTVLTTHYLSEAEDCDRIAIMDDGAIVATGSPGELRAQQGAGATLDDVFFAVTGRSFSAEEQPIGARAQGRTTDRQRSGPRT